MTKKCTSCLEEKSVADFHKKYSAGDGLAHYCKSCANKRSKKWARANKEYVKEYRSREDVKFKRAAVTRMWNRRNVDSTLLTHARKRARSKGLEINIEKEHIQVPDVCPILGIDICVADGKTSDHSPTLDRIDSNKGYIVGNVHVISHRANRFKNDATFEEIEKLYLWFKNRRQE